MTEQDLEMVPGQAHYAARYVRGGRLFSYAHQMNAVLEHDPRTVLEVGPGPGMVTAALRAIGIHVTTVDVQAELKPSVVASVTDLPFESGSFDISMCCQVLEHLPFDQLVPALKELRRCTRLGVLISVPDARPWYAIRGKLPALGRFAFEASRSKPVGREYIDHVWSTAGHYWEIGFPDISLRDLAHAFSHAGLKLRRRWRPSAIAYHHFFFLTDSCG